MKTKNSWTLQKCRLLVNRPSDEVWYQAGPAKASTETGRDDDQERGQREHAEDVDPGRHVRGLPIRQQLVRRELAQPRPAQAARSTCVDSGRRRPSASTGTSGTPGAGRVAVMTDPGPSGTAARCASTKIDDHQQDDDQVGHGDGEPSPAQVGGRIVGAGQEIGRIHRDSSRVAGTRRVRLEDHHPRGARVTSGAKAFPARDFGPVQDRHRPISRRPTRRPAHPVRPVPRPPAR